MSKKENFTYLILGILALIACWNYNFQHIWIGGTIATFITDNLVNPASASIFYDISFLFLSICVWFYVEGTKIGIKVWWLYILVGLVIGISFSFPLFLVHRNYKLKNV